MKKRTFTHDGFEWYLQNKQFRSLDESQLIFLPQHRVDMPDWIEYCVSIGNWFITGIIEQKDLPNRILTEEDFIQLLQPEFEKAREAGLTNNK